MNISTDEVIEAVLYSLAEKAKRGMDIESSVKVAKSELLHAWSKDMNQIEKDLIEIHSGHIQDSGSADDHSGVTRIGVINYLREEACRDVGDNYDAGQIQHLLRNVADYLDETKEKPVVELIDKHELLCYIVKRHTEWVKDAAAQSGNVSHGISIGNVMAFEEIHKWVKEFVQH
jgi:hypothetical protein